MERNSNRTTLSPLREIFDSVTSRLRRRHRVKLKSELARDVLSALVFMLIGGLFASASVGAGLGLKFDANPFGIALLCSASSSTPYIFFGVIFASMFLKSLALPTFLCSIFAICMRVGFALWLSETRAPRFFCEHVALRVGNAIASSALVATYRIISGGFLYYDIIGGIVGLCLTPLFCFIFAGLFDKSKRFTATYEVGIFGFIYAACISLSRFSPLGFSLSSIVAGFLTLFCARVGGVLRGGIGGLVAGLAAFPSMSPAFALMGIGAGFVQSVGAAASSAVAGVAAIAVSLTLGGFNSLRIFAPDIIAACLIFVPFAQFELLPRRSVFSEATLPKAQSRAAMIHSMANAGTTDRLESLSAAMGELSEVFYSLSDRLRSPTASDMRRICEDSFDQYCKKCTNYAICRGSTGNSDATVHLAKVLMRGDRVDKCDLPDYISSYCTKSVDILETMNKARATHDEELLRRDSTRAFAMDYEAMSKLLEYAVSENAAAYELDLSLCTSLEDCARTIGLCASSVAAYGNRKKTVIAGGIDLGRVNVGGEEIRDAFSKVVGFNLSLPEYTIDSDYVSMTLVTEPTYRVEFGRASCVARGASNERDKISGDVITTFSNDEGYHYTLISDGMGSGREAAMTSRTAGIFLDKLLSCGNSKAVSLDMLSNFIRSKNLESFATVDLLEVDLINGEACFVKSGAAPSYILRGDDLFKISSNTMPIGITRELNAEEIRFSLREGDVIVMVSDGVAQSFEDGVWLASMLANEWEDGLDLTESATKILARARSDSNRRDDMTVGVMRICLAN